MSEQTRTILCFGDSNTHGYPPVAMPESRYAFESRWTGVLAAQLGKHWRVIEEGLGGRTTVRDDPVEGEFRSGKRYLLPCLLSHQPIDVAVIALGTNDLKARFNASAWDVAEGIGVLVGILRTSGAGRRGGSPDILLVAPPPIQKVLPRPYDQMFAGAYEKSLQLAREYARLAGEMTIAFLDAGEIVRSSSDDGVHLDEGAHVTLGSAIAAKVRACWPNPVSSVT